MNKNTNSNERESTGIRTLESAKVRRETFAEFRAKMVRKGITGHRLMEARDAWDRANKQGAWNPSLFEEGTL